MAQGKGKASGLPEGCGSAVLPEVLAGGPVIGWVPQKMVPDGRDGYRQVEDGWRGRTGVRRADAFDAMADQAARRGGAALAHDLVRAGRDYRALTEAVMAGGVKLQAWGERTGGGEGRDFMDVYIGQCAALRTQHRCIGAGLALALRRVRPSARGSRVSIRVRTLVDLVCLGDRSVSDVLKLHGWAVSGRTVLAGRDALAEALERMARGTPHMVGPDKGG